jgi:uncharacterized protein (TIGR03118 family)
MKEAKMKNIFGLCGAAILCAHAGAQVNSYTVNNIVTNAQDPNLVNPWGVSRAAGQKVRENQWWVSDQATGLSTLYTASGAIAGLTVTIPPASGSGLGSPTATAANTISTTHVVFAFATLDGTISVWDSNTPPVQPGKACAECHATAATIMVNNAAKGASYTGLTMAKNATSGAPTYYTANAKGGVEAYDATSFSPVTLPPGAFPRPKTPKESMPFGIQAIGSRIFVTYNGSAGGDAGSVIAYDTNGKVLLRLQGGNFNQPWGVALAPANFGAFSGMILVGDAIREPNPYGGAIGAYDPNNGSLQGFLAGSNGFILSIPGLLGLGFGDGSTISGPTNVLYFSAAGPSGEATGAFGSITAN